MIGLCLLALAICLIAAAAIDGRRRRRPARRSTREPGTVLLALLARVRSALPGAVGALTRSGSERVIERAGLSGRVSPRDLAAARLACIAGALALTPRLASSLPPRTLIVFLPFLVWSAAELPMMLLTRVGSRRAQAIRAALPDALDLLGACLAAGLPLRRSLTLVSDHCAEPVAGELATVAAETAFGIPQTVALDGLAARNPQPEVRALVAAIGQAERNGSPLAPVVAGQARESRLAFNRAIVERGARAGPKIQLVVSATLVPAALIAFAAVLIAAVARGELTIL